jgi:NhaP-type Na+/H+ or K+/H+ antiporter
MPHGSIGSKPRAVRARGHAEHTPTTRVGTIDDQLGQLVELTWWYLGVGVLLIAMNMSSALIARLPLSLAIVYFAIGFAMGPRGLGWLNVDPFAQSRLIEAVCELAVLVSLFVTGSNVGGTIRRRHWAVPIRLATVAMVITIGALTAFATFVLGFEIGAAVLLAAVLAPTDPVLAGDVQVSNHEDRDRLRFGLTGEAGLNDGAAFPFVMLGLGLLGLHDLGAGAWRWWIIDLVWAVVGGLGVGALLGVLLGRWLVRRDAEAANLSGSDAFLGLGVVAVAYGIAVALHAYGFLAVFAAAVALQWTVSGPHHRGTSTLLPTPPGRETVATAESALPEQAPTALLQRFNEHLESLFEFGVVLMLGAVFAMVPIPLEAIAVIALLFFVVRPLSVLFALQGTSLATHQRVLASWFGIRGVGSLYYMAYAINHGLQGAEAERLLGITMAVVLASIVLHGISVTPLMKVYEQRQARRQQRT